MTHGSRRAGEGEWLGHVSLCHYPKGMAWTSCSISSHLEQPSGHCTGKLRSQQPLDVRMRMSSASSMLQPTLRCQGGSEPGCSVAGQPGEPSRDWTKTAPKICHVATLTAWWPFPDEVPATSFPLKEQGCSPFPTWPRPFTERSVNVIVIGEKRMWCLLQTINLPCFWWFNLFFLLHWEKKSWSCMVYLCKHKTSTGVHQLGTKEKQIPGHWKAFSQCNRGDGGGSC